MAYNSLIEDIDLVQGDSSPLWFIGLPDGLVLDNNWTGRFVITEKFGAIAILNIPLTKNSGIGPGDTYTPGTKFVFQISPIHSALLTIPKKYDCAVEITNTTINYNGEIARFKINLLKGV